jgi:hypothetical protein
MKDSGNLRRTLGIGESVLALGAGACALVPGIATASNSDCQGLAHEVAELQSELHGPVGGYTKTRSRARSRSIEEERFESALQRSTITLVPVMRSRTVRPARDPAATTNCETTGTAGCQPHPAHGLTPFAL